MKKISFILLLCAIPFTQGCFALLMTAAGHEESKAKYSKLYQEYRLEQEEINARRLNSGLPAQLVLNFHDWLIEQPLVPREVKVFKMFKDITPEEAEEINQRNKKKDMQSGNKGVL